MNGLQELGIEGADVPVEPESTPKNVAIAVGSVLVMLAAFVPIACAVIVVGAYAIGYGGWFLAWSAWAQP
jgi:hypothetical protein